MLSIDRRPGESLGPETFQAPEDAGYLLMSGMNAPGLVSFFYTQPGPDVYGA
jgi:hypothetical protein